MACRRDPRQQQSRAVDHAPAGRMKGAHPGRPARTERARDAIGQGRRSRRPGVAAHLSAEQGLGKKPKAFKIEPIKDTASMAVVQELCDYAYELYEWAVAQHYSEVENMAQELSGKAAKTKYLLTLS